MNPWVCASLIAIAGACGGIVNALLSDNGFALPRRESGVWCPGVISNVLIGAFAAFSSWSFYGSGAAIDLATQSATDRSLISLRFSALAGAFLVGVAGAKWITNEVDKRLLKESVKVAASGKTIPMEQSVHLIEGSPAGLARRQESLRELCVSWRCSGLAEFKRDFWETSFFIWNAQRASIQSQQRRLHVKLNWRLSGRSGVFPREWEIDATAWRI